MHIVLAHWVLVFDDVVGDEVASWEVGGMPSLELLKLASEYINEHGFDGISVRLEF